MGEELVSIGKGGIVYLSKEIPPLIDMTYDAVFVNEFEDIEITLVSYAMNERTGKKWAKHIVVMPMSRRRRCVGS